MNENTNKVQFQQLFGTKIKELRKLKKLSLRQLSQRCNLDYSDIAKYEKGEVNIQLSTVFELSKGLEVHPKVLFDFDFLFNAD
ncbi:helix-turn-helix domain-containing protein [Mariniflexile jejuense]|uniref:Helix-turn-helix domain-containing protein n=1 Tax=Mariniflexile jejuense TaxID=1173582 RepID=A0ABW3JL48_9FLAO